MKQYAYFAIMLVELTELLGNLMLFALEGISSLLAGLHCVRIEVYYVVSRGSRSRIMPCDAMPQQIEIGHMKEVDMEKSMFVDLPFLKTTHKCLISTYINMVAIYSLLRYINPPSTHRLK